MDTLVIKIDPSHFDAAALAPAAKVIRRGGIVGFPTETVYGLAVDLDQPAAVEHLLALRQSPGEKHITVHVASLEQAAAVSRLPACGVARRLVKRFWPGPLTIVVPSEDGRGLGVRFPNHPVARDLIRQAGVRVGAPSANLSGAPAAVDALEVSRVFAGRIDCIVDAGPSQHRMPSTVVRLTGSQLEVLREGVIPRALIEEAGALSVLFVCSGNTCRSPIAEHLCRRMLARRMEISDEELESRGVRIQSAGTSASPGAEPLPEAIQATRELTLDLRKHRARHATPELVAEADRVFAMTGRHVELLRRQSPECASHIELLDPEGRDIEDPFGADLETYRACAARIRTCMETRLADL